MNEKKYWVWLSMALGAGAKTDEILSTFLSPREIYESDRTARIISGAFTKTQIERLGSVKLSAAETAIETCRKNGWQVVTPDDREYPDNLRHLSDMPLVLYVDGDISFINKSLCIGIVGTRNPCAESVAIAQKLSADMAAKRVVIVSGGALGIDSAAHEGALAANGKTVCVLGCGLGNGYLMSNEPLRRRISQSGALISEYPPLSFVTKMSFPLRNRVISGISEGVLVVEAGEKSGSLITAGRAAEQGRDVFAIPGSILSTAYLGANRLIKDGAKVVTCTEDILESYAVMYPEKLDMAAAAPENIAGIKTPADTATGIKPEKTEPKVRKIPSSLLSSDALAVYNAIGDEPIHSDEICAKTGLNTSDVLSALLMLELEDLIMPVQGKCYILK